MAEGRREKKNKIVEEGIQKSRRSDKRKFGVMGAFEKRIFKPLQKFILLGFNWWFVISKLFVEEQRAKRGINFVENIYSWDLYLTIIDGYRNS